MVWPPMQQRRSSRSLSESVAAQELGHMATLPLLTHARHPLLPPEVLQPSTRPSTRGTETQRAMSRSLTALKLSPLPNRQAGPNLLDGLSMVARDQNKRVAQELQEAASSQQKWRVLKGMVRFVSVAGQSGRAATSPPNALRASSSAPLLQTLDSDFLAQEMDSMSSTITQMRKFHDSFSPNRTMGSLRPGADQEGAASAGRAAAAQRRAREEQRERFEQLRYVRKVEPELPPVERSLSPKQTPPNQDRVEFNATSAALQRFKPESRTQLAAELAAVRSQHRDGVARKAVQLKTAAMVKKRQEAASRSASMLAHKQPVEEQLEATQQRLAMVLVVGFMQTIASELQVRRLGEQARHGFVAERWGTLSRWRLSPRTLLSELIAHAHGLRERDFGRRIPLLRVTFLARVNLLRQRKNAARIGALLKSWQSAGPLILHFKRIGLMVRRLQRWWRDRAKWLRGVHASVTRSWLALEKDLARQEAQQMLFWSKMDGPQNVEAKLQEALLPRHVRARFIEHELRARRFFLLPRIAMYEAECTRWRQGIEEWRERRAVRMASGGSLEDFLPFHWFPVQPSYMPNKEELCDMLRRARENPQGWLQLPQSFQSKAETSQSGSLKPRAPSLRVRLKLNVQDEEEDEAYLRTLGITAAHMPGGLARPPPPTEECEED